MPEIRKVLLIFFGTLFVALGVLGMFLPLVPTTVFLLLAAFCYSRSSERFHTWLLSNRWCGKYIRDYKEGRGMAIRDKAVSISLLWMSITISMWVVWGRWWLVGLLAVIAAGVTVHVLLIKTRRTQDECLETETARDPVL